MGGKDVADCINFSCDMRSSQDTIGLWPLGYYTMK